MPIILLTLTENSSIATNDTQGPLKYPHHKIAVGTYFHAQHGTKTKTTPVFLAADGEVSWSLLPSLVSLLSGDTLQTRKHLFLYR